MPRDPLARLVADAHALPTPDEVPPSTERSFQPRGLDRRRARERLADHALGPTVLRRRVRELLGELAARVDDELPDPLARAEQAWDQVDALRLVDRALGDEVRALQAAARAAQADDDAGARALGLEAQLTIDAAMGLVSLVERRLATLVRLRLRAGGAGLLPDGRPFLDLGAALHEAARRWA
jgi:hypothetical protein